MNSSTSNNPTRPNSTNRKSHRKLVPLIITAACAFLLGRQTKTLELYTSDNALVNSINALQFDEQKITDSSEDDDSSSAIEPYNSFIGSQHRLENEDEADFIIRRSYLNSYAHILPCNNATTEKDCLGKTLHHFSPTTEDARGALPPVPWWFQTLLRDTVANGAYGFWHHFTTTDPALNFCTIEKVGTTEWRRVFCDLNEDECPNNGDDKYPPHCRVGLVGRKCAFQTNKKMPSDAPKAVFLRDPLERLLSAFLDKCIKPVVRKHEKHCEPNEVFNTDGWGRKNIVPTKQIEDNPKQFFAAYLDVMPLSWNVHFVPQALYCDLYRTIADYAFVGDMGKEFMVDLERMAHQFKGKLQFQLDKTFGYVKGVEAKRHNNTGKSNGHATRAPEKVAIYYNAASVRKALEYLSIDYVVLGLKVPEWARDMLRKDTM